MESTLSSDAGENGTHNSDNDNEIEWIAIKDIFSNLKSTQTHNQKSIDDISFLFTVEPNSQDELNSFDVVCCKILDDTKPNNKLPTQKPISRKNDECNILNKWDATMTIEGIKNSHVLIQDVISTFEDPNNQDSFPQLPTFNTPPTGIWAYLSGEKFDPLINCRLVENYLQNIYNYCGEELIIEIFFIRCSEGDETGEYNFSKYEECFSELNR